MNIKTHRHVQQQTIKIFPYGLPEKWPKALGLV